MKIMKFIDLQIMLWNYTNALIAYNLQSLQSIEHPLTIPMAGILL